MQKFDHYTANLAVLKTAKEKDLSDEFIVSGIIDKFYVQFELGWKVLKELLKYEGQAVGASGSPRGIIKAAYAIYDFLDEDAWLDMLEDRNTTAHIYDAAAALELVEHILNRYIPEFIQVQEAITARYGEQLRDASFL